MQVMEPQGPHQHWKMSQSRGDNRINSHVQFRIGALPLEYLIHIIYSQAYI